MNKLELLLRKYANNFLILEDITSNSKIEYLNFNNIIIVTDRNLIKIPSLKKVINYLQNNFNTTIIALNSSEPNYEMIESTSKKIFKEKYDLVVALGGGSILDIVKSASMYENSVENVDHFSGSRKKYTHRSVKTLAIPTTAGTGSEYTHTTVYKTRLNIKNWLWDELTYFDYVIYLPILTLDLPANITVASGVDAFDHLIESLMSLKFDLQNLDLCNQGMETIWYSLPNLLENINDYNERTNMLFGSSIAGKAIHFTGCGICHCIAHTLGSLTKVPHGIAVAYGLFHTIEPVLKNNYDLLKRFQGPFKNLTAVSLAKNIQDWLSSMQINYDLIEKKINFEEFINIYYLNDNKSMRDNTFYQPSKSDLKILLDGLWN
jgi:alcohol dehydrogenase class IV